MNFDEAIFDAVADESFDDAEEVIDVDDPANQGSVADIDQGLSPRELTSRQKLVLRIIEKEVQRTGTMPSFSQIAKRLGVSSTNGVWRHVKALEKKGYLKQQSPTRSAYRLPQQVGGEAEGEDGKMLRLPLVGVIAAGVPVESFEQSDRYVELTPRYFGRGEMMVVQVRGSSMSGDAIADGDLAIISVGEALRSFKKGTSEVVAVRVQREEVTLKRVRHNAGVVELLSSNPEYPVRRVPADQVEIIGKLTGVVRRL